MRDLETCRELETWFQTMALEAEYSQPPTLQRESEMTKIHTHAGKLWGMYLKEDLEKTSMIIVALAMLHDSLQLSHTKTECIRYIQEKCVYSSLMNNYALLG